MTSESGGHEVFMRRAIELARGNPGAPFAAILVERDSGAIVAEEINRHTENPTWHGEMDVINRCAARERAVDWARLAQRDGIGSTKRRASCPARTA